MGLSRLGEQRTVPRCSPDGTGSDGARQNTRIIPTGFGTNYRPLRRPVAMPSGREGLSPRGNPPLRPRDSRRNVLRTPIGDNLWAGATCGIPSLQVPSALRPNGTLGRREWRVRIGSTGMVLIDDRIDDATLITRPLDARRPLASAAESEPFFRGTTPARYLHERRIDDDPFFRKRHRAVRQNYSNQTCTRFAPPTRAEDRRF